MSRNIENLTTSDHPFSRCIWFWWQKPKKMSDEDFASVLSSLTEQALTLRQIQDIVGSGLRYTNKFACQILREDRLDDYAYSDQTFYWYEDFSQLLLPEPDLVCHLASNSDQVNHPKHYAANKPFECIALADKYSFALGNAIKYAFRYEDKDRPVEDLKKASWYIRYAIDHDDRFLEPIDWHDEDLCNSYIDILQNVEKNKNMQQFWKHFKNGETDSCLNDLEQRIAELQKKA
jgi:hypothetical protein